MIAATARAQQPGATAPLLITSDTAAVVTVDGEPIKGADGRVEVDELIRRNVPLGEHLVVATSQDGVDVWRKVISIDKTAQHVVIIELASLRRGREERAGAATQQKAAAAQAATDAGVQDSIKAANKAQVEFLRAEINRLETNAINEEARADQLTDQAANSDRNAASSGSGPFGFIASDGARNAAARFRELARNARVRAQQNRAEERQLEQKVANLLNGVESVVVVPQGSRTAPAPPAAHCSRVPTISESSWNLMTASAQAAACREADQASQR